MTQCYSKQAILVSDHWQVSFRTNSLAFICEFQNSLDKVTIFNSNLDTGLLILCSTPNAGKVNARTRIRAELLWICAWKDLTSWMDCGVLLKRYKTWFWHADSLLGRNSHSWLVFPDTCWAFQIILGKYNSGVEAGLFFLFFGQWLTKKSVLFHKNPHKSQC